MSRNLADNLMGTGMPMATARVISEANSDASGTADWGSITNKPAAFPPVAAGADTVGGVKQMAAITDLTAAPTEADFNGLLSALRTAGILAAS